MKNRIKYLLLFSIFLISCTGFKFIGKPAYILPEYDTVIYGPIENGKEYIIPKEKIEKKEKNQGYIRVEYKYPAPVDITRTNDDNYILEIGEIEILDRNGKIVKSKEKIPPLLFKKTIVRALKKNFVGSEDIYYRGWAEDYPKDPSTLKKIN